MDKDYCRRLTHESLVNELVMLSENYMKVYDEYYETGSRDSAFLKDLVDAIKGISACLEVYTNYGKIDPIYAVEKLNYTINMVDSVKRFYDNQLEKEDEDGEES